MMEEKLTLSYCKINMGKEFLGVLLGVNKRNSKAASIMETVAL